MNVKQNDKDRLNSPTFSVPVPLQIPAICVCVNGHQYLCMIFKTVCLTVDEIHVNDTREFVIVQSKKVKLYLHVVPPTALLAKFRYTCSYNNMEWNGMVHSL